MTTSMRRDRLLGLLHRGSTTVPAAAVALGVSERTIHRDIAALRERGHDVQATPGRGGGVGIAPESRPRPVHFEVDEVVGLALSLAVLEATPHRPFARSAEAAVDRARQALSAERQRALRRLLRRIFVGVPATEPVRESLGPVDDAVLSVFERCFTHAKAMAFDYVDRGGASSSRRVECLALLHHPPAWYVVAWDLDRDASRVFRMDRITAAAPGDALVGRHALAEVIPQGPDDPWERRSIGR